MRRKVIRTYTSSPSTHYEVEVKGPNGWAPLSELHGIEWGLAFPEKFPTRGSAMLTATELTNRYPKTRVVEVRE